MSTALLDRLSARRQEIDFIPLILPAGQRSLMRDSGRLITAATVVITLFTLMISIKFGVRPFLFVCLAAMGIGALMWIVGTIEARLIEIRNAMGGSVEQGPDRPFVWPTRDA